MTIPGLTVLAVPHRFHVGHSRDSHGLGRSDVVAGLEVGNVDEAKKFGEVFGGSSQGETTAHLWCSFRARSPRFYHDFTEVRKTFGGSFDTQRTL